MQALRPGTSPPPVRIPIFIEFRLSAGAMRDNRAETGALRDDRAATAAEASASCAWLADHAHQPQLDADAPDRRGRRRPVRHRRAGRARRQPHPHLHQHRHGLFRPVGRARLCGAGRRRRPAERDRRHLPLRPRGGGDPGRGHRRPAARLAEPLLRLVGVAGDLLAPGAAVVEAMALAFPAQFVLAACSISSRGSAGRGG